MPKLIDVEQRQVVPEQQLQISGTDRKIQM